MNITISKTAKETIAAKVKEDQKIRIYITGKGWGGPRFGLSLDEAQDNDIEKEVDGLTFIIEKKLDHQYNGMGVKIEYQKGLLKKGFIVSLKDGSNSCK